MTASRVYVEGITAPVMTMRGEPAAVARLLTSLATEAAQPATPPTPSVIVVNGEGTVIFSASRCAAYPGEDGVAFVIPQGGIVLSGTFLEQLADLVGATRDVRVTVPPESADVQAVLEAARAFVSRPMSGSEWRQEVTNDDYQRLHGAVLALDGGR